MSTLNNTPDELDGRLSDFFKNQLPRPWPKAPVTASAPVAAPLALVAAAQNRPAPRDNFTRARFTLAASVALLLGTCWYLSSGYTPSERNNGGPGAAPGAPGTNANDFGADGNKSPLFKGIGKHAADKGSPGIDLHKVND